METAHLKELLAAVKDGQCGVEQALERLRKLPFETLGYANVDHHRALRCGHSEVIFCQGKTVPQVLGIMAKLGAGGQRVLATRASEEQMDALAGEFPQIVINRMARAALLNDHVPVAEASAESGEPFVMVLSAGTADMPVAEEAAFTLRFMGVPAARINDAGVSGLHRLLSHVELIQKACALVVVAGMEGALPSVVGGLVAAPVFAVPTSVGYGASFGGLAAMLGMLNSCSSNVSVVNIDNGFGAASCAGKVYLQVTNHAKVKHV